MSRRCEHGLTSDCEQCLEAQAVADEQATDEDWTDVEPEQNPYH